MIKIIIAFAMWKSTIIKKKNSAHRKIYKIKKMKPF